MKTKFFLFIILFLGINIDNVLSISDQMAVQILPGDYTQPYEVRNLEVGVLKFLNNTGITIKTVAPEFADYKYLALNTSASYKGQIVPSATGEIYLVASGTLESFMLSANWAKTTYQVQYQTSTGTTTTLYIYKKSVQYGDTVNIPISSNYAGVAPVAYNMTVKPDVSTIERSINSDSSDYFLIKNNMLMFSEKITQPMNVSIYNVDGRLVLQKNGINSNYKISTEILKKGIYIIRLNLSTGLISQKILIK
ncbi:MAG: T9SS type A sorting domain-containing protein [Paludibacter sp.]|nr:T9SS type A sorting domain-containing protein [Paludibacter sp.]